MSRKSRPLPQALVLAQGRFEDWRRTRQTRWIPDPLWSLAVELAKEHGSFRTASALRLNADTLKKRLGGSSTPTTTPQARNKPSPKVASEPAFIEVDAISAPARMRTGEGSVEIETADGARMRIEWRRGEAPPDVLALGRGLFGAAR